MSGKHAIQSPTIPLREGQLVKMQIRDSSKKRYGYIKAIQSNGLIRVVPWSYRLGRFTIGCVTYHPSFIEPLVSIPGMSTAILSNPAHRTDEGNVA